MIREFIQAQADSMEIFLPLFASIILIVAGIFGTITIVVAMRTLLLLTNSESVMGEVVGFSDAPIARVFSIRTPGSSVVFYPKIKYLLPDGKSMITITTKGRFKRNLEVGQQVKLLFRRRKPQYAIIDDFWDVWGRLFFTGILTLALIFFGAFVL